MADPHPLRDFWWACLDFIFESTRWALWKDYDPNEDFSCGQCGKPVFSRFIFCSDRCYRLSDWAHRRTND